MTRKNDDKRPIVLTDEDLYDNAKSQSEKDEETLNACLDEVESQLDIGEEDYDDESDDMVLFHINPSLLRKILIGLVIALALCIIWLFLAMTDVVAPIGGGSIALNDAVCEYGDTNYSIVKRKNGNEILQISAFDAMLTGKQNVEVHYKDKEGKQRTATTVIEVKDTQKPQITIRKNHVTTELGEYPDFSELGIEAKDPIDGKISYQIRDLNVNTIGKSQFTVVAIDTNDNKSTKKVQLTVTGHNSLVMLNRYRSDVETLSNAYEQEQENKKLEEERKQKEEEEKKIENEEYKVQYENLVTQIGKMNSQDYTVESWQTLQNVIISTQDMESYKDAFTTLKGAMDNLQKNDSSSNETDSPSTYPSENGGETETNKTESDVNKNE